MRPLLILFALLASSLTSVAHAHPDSYTHAHPHGAWELLAWSILGIGVVGLSGRWLRPLLFRNDRNHSGHPRD